MKIINGKVFTTINGNISGKIHFNNRVVNIPHGSCFEMVNGQFIIDGKPLEQYNEADCPTIKIELTGNVESIQTADGDVTVNGNVHYAKTMSGDIKCKTIEGDAKTMSGDIMHIDWLQVPDFDLLTYSFPCQDISSAGRQRGFSQGSGTRSSLLWACADAIEAKHPKYLLMENVKALTQKKFAKDFYKWREWLSVQGYTSYYQILNAKEYGIPQNRERVFMVSVLGEHQRFFFPKTIPLEYRLKDILEDHVDESYYLKPQQVESIVKHCERKIAEGCGFKVNFQTPDGISGAIKTKEGQREYDTYIKEPLNPDTKGNSRTITAHYHKLGYTDFSSDLCPHTGVMEFSACALRGRGEGWVQQLEIGGNIANTITTVQKDSMVLEPLFLGYTRDHKGKVVSHNLKDISNTIVASNHGRNGSTAQYLVEPMIYSSPHGFNFGG